MELEPTVSSERLPETQTETEANDKEEGDDDDVDVDVGVGRELVDSGEARKPPFDLAVAEDDAAICTRTRARYSLASFTLDELETFLQESDDEDDLQNVDDEEEYRKFLASVLQGNGDGNGESNKGNEIVGDEEEDDDDEDNDADFEIELEEALESDADENVEGETEKGYERVGRRPLTRQNRCQNEKAKGKKKSSTPTKRPLRPLFPVLSNVPVSSFSSAQDRMTTRMAQINLGGLPSATMQGGYTSAAFSPNQIGQLHCLIQEHVQLLIQVYCLCVHDSSRQHIASQVQKLIHEMLDKRGEVMSWKTVPYPSTCFDPQILYPSVQENIPKSPPMPRSLESSPSNDVDNEATTSNEASTSQNNRSEREGLIWVPCISGRVTAILDVAPLSLAGKFFNDVERVQATRQRHVGSSSEFRVEKEPLFPFSGYHEVSPSNSQRPSKKTLAATLVESTMKQSVALVPTDISKLAQIFVPLFNPALYPHKPPLAAVANRVLFTDSEDELLALGILEYNTDWKAIQERFLPCKSKHQIFVRQKNRCSSKAQENSIKAIRRMKTSPLNAEEIASIQEGLKVFKCNLMLVWRFIVPHRDPSLLPRQWRAAIGTQKSFKLDAEAKEKRRLSNENRRRSKAVDLACSQNRENAQVEKPDTENNTAEGKTYVHEAFLADWRPRNSNGYSCVNLPGYPQYPFHIPSLRQPGPTIISSNNPASATTSYASKSQLYKPFRSRRKTYGKNLVKLSPDLPLLNLPPSVRVVSQSAFRDSLHATASTSSAFSPTRPMHVDLATAKTSEAAKEKCVEDERSNDSDLQMHPLLYQDPKEGRLPYAATNSSSFSFFPGNNQPQLNLSLLHNNIPQQENQLSAFHSSLQATEGVGIHFHPLLRRTDFAQLLQYPLGAHRPQSSVKPADKGNELDLEIHLSSRAPAKVTSIVRESGFTTETRMTSAERYRQSESTLANTGNPSSGDRSPVLPTDLDDDDMGDQSNPGIVMEQEELSDSDEEMEENVEFECEEMTDSEGDEGSGREQVPDMEIEVKGPNHHRGKLSDPGKDGATNSSWLSLDSSREPHSSIGGNLDTKPSLTSSRPSRCCKKKSLSSEQVGQRRQGGDGNRKTGVAPPILRKPRKRTRS